MDGSADATFKTRVYEILELAHPDDFISRSFQTLIFTLIGLNVIALIIDSDSAFGLEKPLLVWFEAVLAFSIEYVLRMWSCTSAPSYSHPFWGSPSARRLILRDLSPRNCGNCAPR